jgi:hypothetical protein
MYFGVYLVATQFRCKMSATAAPFEWLSTVNHKRIAVSLVVKRKAECRLLFFFMVAKFVLDRGRTSLLSSLSDDARPRFRHRWLAPGAGS